MRCQQDYHIWTKDPKGWVNQYGEVYVAKESTPAQLYMGYFVFCVLVIVSIAGNFPQRKRTAKETEIINIIMCCVMFVLALPPMLHMYYATLQNNTLSEV